MEDKPIVEIRAINYWKVEELSTGEKIRHAIKHDLVYRRQGENTWSKIKVELERHISEAFKDGEVLQNKEI